MNTERIRRLYRWTRRDAAATASEEFRYLDAFLCQQLAQAAGDREVIADAPPAHVGEADAVLRLGSDRVMATAATLRALLQALEGGADVAVATPLAESGDPAAAEVSTLASFEMFEVPHHAPSESDPIADLHTCPALSLWRARIFSQTGAGQAVTRLPAGANIVRRGMFHEFIDYHGEVRSDVLPFIPEDVRDVLEVGCARGLTGALIQESYGCRVTGVDLNPVVAAEARTRLHVALCGDIEELELNGQFDAVVALELFEHLRDPIRFGRRMKALLRPGGRLVLSVPNVGHYAVVRDLARGRWDYLPIGILCYTHLRFFTAPTLRDWLAMAGYRRVEIVRQRTKLPANIARWAAGLPGADLDSLATKAFWVLATA